MEIFCCDITCGGASAIGYWLMSWLDLHVKIESFSSLSVIYYFLLSFQHIAHSIFSNLNMWRFNIFFRWLIKSLWTPWLIINVNVQCCYKYSRGIFYLFLFQMLIGCTFILWSKGWGFKWIFQTVHKNLKYSRLKFLIFFAVKLQKLIIPCISWLFALRNIFLKINNFYFINLIFARLNFDFYALLLRNIVRCDSSDQRRPTQHWKLKIASH